MSRKHKHSLAECKARYEIGNGYSLRKLAEWSGYQFQYLGYIAKKENWQKDKNKTDTRHEAIKKIQDDEINSMAAFDRVQIKYVKQANGLLSNTINALTKQSNSGRVLDFQDIKTLRICLDTGDLARRLQKDILHIDKDNKDMTEDINRIVERMEALK